MRKNEPITHIMSSDLITVHVAQKLSEVRAALESNKIHHIPVVNGDKLIGIISTSDMLNLSAGGWGGDQRSLDAMLDHQFTIKDVLTADVQTVPTSGTVRDAAQRLGEGAYHSVPVVDDDQTLRGIVTSTDLIRYLLDQY